MQSDSSSPGDLAAGTPVPSSAVSGNVVSGNAVPGEAASGGPAAQDRALPAFGSTGVAASTSRFDAHILVVDDEPINVKVIQKFLGGAGYQRISSAESGLQALEMVAREMPDLVLLDVFLADVNGIEVLKRLRALPGGKKLPVLILTASTDADLERCALDLGAIGFITKPISHGELIAWLQKTLSASG
jgi:CheY-like chemotaxis protein